MLALGLRQDARVLVGEDRGVGRRCSVLEAIQYAVAGARTRATAGTMRAATRRIPART
jgi:hypothetical protein